MTERSRFLLLNVFCSGLLLTAVGCGQPPATDMAPTGVSSPDAGAASVDEPAYVSGGGSLESDADNDLSEDLPPVDPDLLNPPTLELEFDPSQLPRLE